jgi:hypothetical protein
MLTCGASQGKNEDGWIYLRTTGLEDERLEGVRDEYPRVHGSAFAHEVETAPQVIERSLRGRAWKSPTI